MGGDPRTAASDRRASLFAAALAVVVAVGSDVVAGGHPLHTAMLGAAVSVVSVLRLRYSGRRRHRLLAVTGAALLFQPVLEAVTRLVPAGAGAAGHAAGEGWPAILHVAIAALVVSAVAGSEHLYLLLVAGFAPAARWLAAALLRQPRPRHHPDPPPGPPTPARRPVLVVQVPRRGPPSRVAAAR